MCLAKALDWQVGTVDLILTRSCATLGKSRPLFDLQSIV